MRSAGEVESTILASVIVHLQEMGPELIETRMNGSLVLPAPRTPVHVGVCATKPNYLRSVHAKISPS